MALEGHDVCGLVWALLVADSGAGGVNTLVGGTPGTPGRIYQGVIRSPCPASPSGWWRPRTATRSAASTP
jgi:hypothetical protein